MADKVEKVMGEFKEGTLHSGSKEGPKVTDPAQAKAIAMSEARKAGQKVKAKPVTSKHKGRSHSYRRGSVRVDSYQSEE